MQHAVAILQIEAWLHKIPYLGVNVGMDTSVQIVDVSKGFVVYAHMVFKL